MITRVWNVRTGGEFSYQGTEYRRATPSERRYYMERFGDPCRTPDVVAIRVRDSEWATFGGRTGVTVDEASD